MRFFFFFLREKITNFYFITERATVNSATFGKILFQSTFLSEYVIE